MKSPNPPGLCASRCVRYLTAGVFLLAVALPRPARGEPCPQSTVMREGAVAPCGGVLVSGRRAAQCVADSESLTACRIRLEAEVTARGIAAAGWDDERAALLAALDAERQAARQAAVPEVGTDWSAFGWGVGTGAVAALAAAVAVAAAVR